MALGKTQATWFTNCIDGLTPVSHLVSNQSIHPPQTYPQLFAHLLGVAQRPRQLDGAFTIDGSGELKETEYVCCSRASHGSSPSWRKTNRTTFRPNGRWFFVCWAVLWGWLAGAWGAG